MVVAAANGNVVMTIILFTSSVFTLQYIEKEDFIRDDYFPEACCDQYSVIADRDAFMLCTQQSC